MRGTMAIIGDDAVRCRRSQPQNCGGVQTLFELLPATPTFLLFLGIFCSRLISFVWGCVAALDSMVHMKRQVGMIFTYAA